MTFTQILIIIVTGLITLGLGKLWGEAQIPKILTQIRDMEKTLIGKIQDIELTLRDINRVTDRVVMLEEKVKELETTNEKQYIILDKVREDIAKLKGALS